MNEFNNLQCRINEKKTDDLHLISSHGRNLSIRHAYLNRNTDESLYEAARNEKLRLVKYDVIETTIRRFLPLLMYREKWIVGIMHISSQIRRWLIWYRLNWKTIVQTLHCQRTQWTRSHLIKWNWNFLKA